MPRATRKRRLQNPQKAPLRFVDEARSGSRHDQGPQLRSAVHPRSFLSESTRQGVPAVSWVSPQFTSLEATAVRCNAQNKKKRKKKNPLPTRTSLSTPVRRSAVCRFPALLFETSNPEALRRRQDLSAKSSASRVVDSPERRAPEGRADRTGSPVIRDDVLRLTSLSTEVHNHKRMSEAGRHELGAGRATPPSSVTARTCTPDTRSVLAPRVETPQTPHLDRPASPSLLGLLFSPSQPQTPPRTENVLVRDTPESDYGLKVTWRRRKKLLRLLTQRGHLVLTNVRISNQAPEVV